MSDHFDHFRAWFQTCGSFTDERLAEVFPIATDENEFINRIEQYFECGFDHVCVQLNCFNDEKALDLFAKKVLAYFRD